MKFSPVLVELQIKRFHASWTVIKGCTTDANTTRMVGDFLYKYEMQSSITTVRVPHMKTYNR